MNTSQPVRRSTKRHEHCAWLIGLCLLLGGPFASAAPTATAPAAARPETAPTTTPARDLGPKTAKVGGWQPIFAGVDYAMAETQTPRPLKVHAVRVSLNEPGIQFFVTPSNGDRPRETDGLKTSTFLIRYRCQVAINASPFEPFAKAEGDPMDVVGLSISRGDMYSGPHDTFGALRITRENHARVAVPPYTTRSAYNAVGGFGALLRDGKNVAEDDKLNPRTAVGVSKDGRYLYLVAIDGRQKGYSEGTSQAETAEWMRLFGSHSALNLDGGGSTCLAISDGKGGAKILNRPINNDKPGTERIVANHLGVYAKALGPTTASGAN